MEKELEACWFPIYNQLENKISSDDCEKEIMAYTRKFYDARSMVDVRCVSDISLETGSIVYNYCNFKIPNQLSEHYEMALPGIPKVLSKMENPTIQPDEVEAQLKKLKKGKAPGPDSIKPELFMHLVKNPNLIKKLTVILNDII